MNLHTNAGVGLTWEPKTLNALYIQHYPLEDVNRNDLRYSVKGIYSDL